MSHPFEKLAALKGRLAPGPDDPPAATSPGPFSDRIVVRRERKGRGGKTVTLVQGIRAPDEALDAIARDMKKALGCGATIENGALVLQGDIAERAIVYLQKLGATKVVRGTG